MVIDEGHNTSSKTTNFSRIIHKMSVECRWIVTGTPTSKHDPIRDIIAVEC